MRKQISLLLVLSMVLVSAGCNKGGDATMAPSSVDTSVTATSAAADDSFELPSLFGDQVFTKEQIQAKIDGGLSEGWEDYQLNTMLANIDSLPDNVKESLKNAFGEYKWDSYKAPDFKKWEAYFTETPPEAEKMHAVMDLYGVSPNMEFPKAPVAAVEKAVSDNPKIDMSQYATYEDGDAFIPFYKSYGSEVLAENKLIKVEGVSKVTIEPYENYVSTLKITNVSGKPVYVDMNGVSKKKSEITKKFRSMPDYDPAYDKSDAIANDETVLPFNTKDVLYPGEVTYLTEDLSSHKDLDLYTALFSYQMNDEDIAKLKTVKSEKDIGDLFARIRTREKCEETYIIQKCRLNEKESWDGGYATIKGVLYNKDGQRLPFMSFQIMGLDETMTVDEHQYFTSIDGSFSVRVPVAFYKADMTYARYVIYVNGERVPIDGKLVTMVVGELYALDGEVQEGKKYSDFIKGRRIYGQKSEFVQPTEAKEYNVTLIVPDKLDYLVYDYASEEDYGGQANYYDYGGDIMATVKFHDVERGANKTAYLNVFDHDGKLLMRKPLGVQSCCVCVSPDGSLVGTNISDPKIFGSYDLDDMTPGNIGYATIFDLKGNKVFELKTGTRAMEISHDNKYVALDVNGGYCVGVMDINTKEVLWQDYRGAQIRHLIFSEDDSILYMGSQECIAAYEAKTGKMLWQTFIINGFPIDMIMSGKYLYVSPKGTGGNDCKLCCIDRKTGKMVWTYQTGSRGTKLTLSPDESILFWGNDTGARDHGTYFLDANTGAPLWTINYGAQAAWFTSDSKYVAVKAYSMLEVYTRDGRKVATTACGFNSKMSWFVYIKDDLSRILNIAGGGAENGAGNSGWMYNMTLAEGYDRKFIDSQL